MPRAFEITSPASSLSLDAAQKGDVTFAVTNQLDHAAKVRASIVTEGATKPEWLSLAEAVKEVNVKQTETFTVRVAVPAGTTIGDYSFKIVAASEANPEEESTEGPSVKFHVGPTQKKKIPWLWIAVAAGAVLLGVGAYVFWPRGRPTSTLNQRCDNDGNCARAEKCTELESTLKVCLLRPREKCATDASCSSAWCKDDKTCSNDDGSCAADADCPSSTIFICTNKQCLKRLNQTCTTSSDCSTGNCKNGFCRSAISECSPACRLGMQCVDGACKPFKFDPVRYRSFRERLPIVVPGPHP